MQRIWLVPFLSAFTLVHAASFDCTKAATPQEKAICASPELSAADDQMAAAYHAWLTAAEPDWAAGIRDDQRAWLRVRATSCPAGQSSKPITTCLSHLYQGRIEELRQNVKTLAGVTFVARSVTLTTRDEPDSVPTWATEVTPGFGTLRASWPQVASAAPQWTAWNSAIVTAAIQTASEGQQPAPHDWNGVVQSGVDQQVDVTVDRFDGKLVSATIDNFFDGHGAHPNHNSSEFYWLIDKQRALKAEDVFKPNSGWDTWMAGRLDGYLHKALDGESNGDYKTWFPQGDAAKQLHGIVTDPQGWTLEPKGLTIVFQPYEVACYACTPEPLTIAWSELKPYLQPGFSIPR